MDGSIIQGKYDKGEKHGKFVTKQEGSVMKEEDWEKGVLKYWMLMNVDSDFWEVYSLSKNRTNYYYYHIDFSQRMSRHGAVQRTVKR